jgi:hypothetical protein
VEGRRVSNICLEQLEGLLAGLFGSYHFALRRTGKLESEPRDARITDMRYKADITAGSLKVRESRLVAGVLLQDVDDATWKFVLEEENILQARNLATAKRIGGLLRQRLGTMNEGLWEMVRDGSAVVATHACLAAAVKHSALLGDFLDLVVRDQYRLFSPALSNNLWEKFIEDCRARDPEMPEWSESTIARLRSTVFQILAQAGYIESTRSLKLQTNHIATEVLRNLRDHDERYVLRCIEVAP